MLKVVEYFIAIFLFCGFVNFEFASKNLLGSFISIFRLLGTFYYTYVFLRQRAFKLSKNDAFVLLTGIYIVWVIITTVLSPSGSIYNALYNSYGLIGCVLLVFTAKRNKKEFLLAGSVLFFLLITLNTFETALFHNNIDPVGDTWYLIGHQNQYGQKFALMAAVIYSYCEEYLHNKLLKSVLKICLLLMMIIDSWLMQSSNTLICTGLIVLLFSGLFDKFFFWVFKGLRIFVLYLFGWVSVVVLKVQDFFVEVFIVLFNKNATFSQRTMIWDNLIAEMPNYFWIGNGVQSDGNISYSVLGENYHALSAHNVFLQEMYYGGIVSIGLVCLIFICVLRKRKCYASRFCLFGIFVTLMNLLVEALGLQVLFFLLAMYDWYSFDKGS